MFCKKISIEYGFDFLNAETGFQFFSWIAGLGTKDFWLNQAYVQAINFNSNGVLDTEITWKAEIFSLQRVKVIQ